MKKPCFTNCSTKKILHKTLKRPTRKKGGVKLEFFSPQSHKWDHFRTRSVRAPPIRHYNAIFANITGANENNIFEPRTHFSTITVHALPLPQNIYYLKRYMLYFSVKTALVFWPLFMGFIFVLIYKAVYQVVFTEIRRPQNCRREKWNISHKLVAAFMS